MTSNDPTGADDTPDDATAPWGIPSSVERSAVERFLAHAIQLEAEAARRYEELAAAMQTDGNAELKAFFLRMAHFSRLHLADAKARGGFRELPKMAPEEYEWPEGTSPETAEWAGVDAQMDAGDALRLAIGSERRGHAYYAAIAASTTDQELSAIAREFADEEAQHVVELEKLIAARATA
ncbi:ferritin family protein [Ideonella sp. A 288]|uniref:ferritin-like domain-containing protein n=1 Tax=Ideonella sp. A 288 TaxID=1962181 RepID=UPI0011860963|nr:ferritin family protein [Ideonella sp. A 288]